MRVTWGGAFPGISLLFEVVSDKRLTMYIVKYQNCRQNSVLKSSGPWWMSGTFTGKIPL